MSVITEMQLAIETIQTQMANLCRPATVSYVYRKSGEKGIKTDRDPGDKFIGYVDVQSGELEIWRIPVMAIHNGADTTLWLPTEGESGYLFSPSGDLAQAFFVNGAPTEQRPLPVPEGQATKSVVRKFRDGQTETVDTEQTQYTYQIGEDGTPTRIINTEKIEDSFGTPKRVIEEDKIEDSFGTPKRIIEEDKIEDIFSTLKRSIDASKIEDKAGTNAVSLSSILLNLMGAHIYASGTTTFLTSMGPVLFTPAPSPPAAPAPPAGSAPDSEGNATQVPEQTVEDIKITDGDITFTIPSLTVNVTGTAGPYPIVATAATVLKSITPDITASDITLVIPPAPLS